ncbi:hypothetical protein AB7044_03820 [Providencia stuartii]|uniref:hypothetical protein n=1 Tax=Providencia stuartii TaxID=588 RepID=UPI00331CBE2B
MKLEQAYSLELKKDITAEDADTLFTKGILASKHLFECPERDCHAQVTCANLDKPKRLRKREPYFKFVSEHIAGCRIEAESDTDIRQIKATQEDPEALPFILDDIVDLDLSSPNKKSIRELPVSDSDSAVEKRLRRSINEHGDGIKHRHSRKRLSGLVNAFINKENFFLNTLEGILPLRDFFIKINDHKSLKEYPDEPRIYFGKAWLNRHKESYLVRFDNKMQADELNCRPTFFIPDRLVERSEYSRTSRETLEKIVDANKPLYLFIFSELPPVKSNNGNYINFKLDDLTYLYYLPFGKKNI